ncbi:Lrp/AsnC family transcriptional regulator [Devosia sp.]|uniref:Lrp/AsnC family transcriptional regulator n=1 Tax=Devosia sp. TaxID=1871048 RepID=UPI002F1C7D4A
MNARIARLDAVNRRILETLQLNAAMTNQQLAEAVNLSASACHSRVQALERAGIIRRYIADLDVNKLPSSLSAFIEVSLDSHHAADFAAFDAIVAGIPAIVWSYKISGPADYMLLAIVRDMGALRRLTDDLIECSGAIAKLTTIPVLERLKSFAGIPVEALFSSAGADE